MKIASAPVICTAALVAAALAPTASGQLITSSTLDTGAGFTVFGDADTTAEFGYDYSADGIPSAPNGTGTLGLKMTANNNVDGLDTAAAAVVSAQNDTFINAPFYTVSVDAWVNAVGPFPGGGAGSTEFAGMSIGRVFSTSADIDGGSFIYTGEGGSSRDYRLYKGDSFTGEQFVESGQYNTVTNNNVDVVYGGDATTPGAFPGVSPPASQGDSTVTANGAGGFQWMTVTALVDAAASSATFSITSATSGNTVVVGTLDGTNASGTFPTAGNAAVVFADLFNSVSGNPALSFGVFDNFSVTEVSEIPEPASLALLGLGGIAMLRRRAR